MIKSASKSGLVCLVCGITSKSTAIIWSCQDGEFIIMVNAHTLACNQQQRFLNQGKKENKHRQYFMINLCVRIGLQSNS